MSVWLLFCWVLLLGYVQNNTQHSYVNFSAGVSVNSKRCKYTVSIDTTKEWNNSRFILSESSDLDMVINEIASVHALSIYFQLMRYCYRGYRN